MTTPEPVRVARVLPVTPERAFVAFTRGFSAWWPPEYTFAGRADLLSEIRLGRAAGEVCSEFGPSGFRIDWGRVTVWEPPHRLVFLWQIGPDRAPNPDPAVASQVAIEISAQGHGVEVALTHDAFERHGDDGGRYRDEMANEAGWPLLIDRFADYAIGDAIRP